MTRPNDTIYFFPIMDDGSGFSHVDKSNAVRIEYLVGTFLAEQLCDCSAGIELVRMRIGSDVVIAQRRWVDIRVIVEHRKS